MNKNKMKKKIVNIINKIYPIEHPEWLSYIVIGLSKQLNEKYDTLTICDCSSNMTIALCTCKGNDIPYFILFNDSDIYLATKCARISLTEPKYITTKKYGLKKNWILTDSEIDELINLLKNKPISIFSRRFKNNYDCMVHLYQTIIEEVCTTDIFENPLTIQMPDYTKLK